MEEAGEAVVGTGVTGLDNVLGGGLTAHRFYLVEGAPGTGKTTIALQFLLQGLANGEPVLYVTLSETAEELNAVARAHGWNLNGVHVRELLPGEAALEPDEQYTVFHPSELELSQTIVKMLGDVELHAPTRVVIDSLSELRLLAAGSLRYRRQILALKQFFVGRRCTVLLLDDTSASDQGLQVQSLAHAVVKLEQLTADYGPTRRRLVVTKFRGRAYRAGYHDYKILRGGLKVFPRLIAHEHVGQPAQTAMSSGLPQLDALLGGGIERGTSTLISGAPGTGKSSVAVQLSVAATRRGESVALYIFDESIPTLLTRSRALGMDLQPGVDEGRVVLRQVDPAELSPGELVHEVREVVDQGVSLIVIDSLNGLLQAMPDERFLIEQLHELLTFLGQAGVATVLVGAQHGLIGTNMHLPVDASYLADAVVLLRYFELDGEVRQAISVVKKRSGRHERTIRALSMSGEGLVIGEPLRGYRGVLTGVPTPNLDRRQDARDDV